VYGCTDDGLCLGGVAMNGAANSDGVWVGVVLRFHGASEAGHGIVVGVWPEADLVDLHGGLTCVDIDLGPSSCEIAERHWPLLSGVGSEAYVLVFLDDAYDTYMWEVPGPVTQLAHRLRIAIRFAIRVGE